MCEVQLKQGRERLCPTPCTDLLLLVCLLLDELKSTGETSGAVIVEGIKEFLLFLSPRDIKLLQKETKEKESNLERKVLVCSLPPGPEFLPQTNNIHSQNKGGGWKRACWLSLLSGSVISGTCLSSLIEMRLVELSSFCHSRKNKNKMKWSRRASVQPPHCVGELS